MKSSAKRDQIAESLRELVASYSATMVHLEKTLVVLCQELGIDEISPWFDRTELHPPTHPDDVGNEPIADRSILAVRWRGMICFLGNTLPFRLFERLALRPNQYVSCEELLDDVWEGRRTSAAVRSTVKVLRKKLIAAGMSDLASAIDGSVFGHYGLILKSRS